MTHPEVKKFEGESYRFELQRIIKELDLHEHVIFHNHFVSKDELNGFLSAADIYVTPAARVDLWGTKGKVQGIFGHPAIHVQDDKFKTELDKMFIDLGLSSREDVEEKGIRIGTPITMSGDYFKIDNYYCGKSLDDKIGGYINSEILRRFDKDKVELPFNLIAINAVQEEVGLHGAQMAANNLKPDIALVIDVTHDTTSPAYSREIDGHIIAGEGCVLLDGPSIQKNLLKLLIDTAENKDIKYQITTLGRGSGTNADAYAYPAGIPTALITMGLRYMHTPSEMVHKDDVESAICILIETLKNKVIIKDLNYKI
jgi:putative aminopeptidase FrvX